MSIRLPLIIIGILVVTLLAVAIFFQEFLFGTKVVTIGENISPNYPVGSNLPKTFDLESAEGNGCRVSDPCNDLVGVNCRAEVDGPFYYVNKNTEEIVAYCGGYCMTQDCTNTCPPKEWTCN